MSKDDKILLFVVFPIFFASFLVPTVEFGWGDKMDGFRALGFAFSSVIGPFSAEAVTPIGVLQSVYAVLLISGNILVILSPLLLYKGRICAVGWIVKIYIFLILLACSLYTLVYAKWGYDIFGGRSSVDLGYFLWTVSVLLVGALLIKKTLEYEFAYPDNHRERTP